VRAVGVTTYFDVKYLWGQCARKKPLRSGFSLCGANHGDDQ